MFAANDLKPVQYELHTEPAPTGGLASPNVSQTVPELTVQGPSPPPQQGQGGILTADEASYKPYRAAHAPGASRLGGAVSEN